MSIVLTELTKWFGDSLVVNRVSLEVKDGELFVLLGGSGSGKSTILRLIAGLIEPSSGCIELHGKDVTNLPVQKRGTGFVFQNYSVFRHMTVAENIEFGLRIRKTPLAERRQRSAELLELVGLAGLGDRFADQLSGGQQQRVALARALAYSPAVLLLDEPFGALDVKIRAQLRVSLKEIQRQLGVTTILVTHDQQEAFELADRIGVIERGDLLEVGTPEELYYQPQNEFVATFVGGGNVLVGREEEGYVRLGNARLPLPPDGPQHDPGSPIRVLFRPETVLLQSQPFSEENGIYELGSGDVVKRIFTGDSQRVVLEVENLKGARSPARSWVYGQLTTRIEALIPAQPGGQTAEEVETGQQLWIGLRNFHVLAPSEMKLLVVSENLPEDIALSTGCKIGEAIGGKVTVVSVADSGENVVRQREALEAIRQQWQSVLPHLETKVRQGEPGIEIVREAQEGHYELVVLGPGMALASKGDLRLNFTVQQILRACDSGVLLVHGVRTQLKRLLVCTATGEPGKSDVLFGARLARHADAHVNVLHVEPFQFSARDRQRIERHLAQAKALLDGQGIQNDIKILIGPVADTILKQAIEDDSDLIVIGAPGPRAFHMVGHSDLATQIVSRSDRPVVIVPMQR